MWEHFRCPFQVCFAVLERKLPCAGKKSDVIGSSIVPVQLNYILNKNHIINWWEIQKERDHWVDQDVGGWTILKLVLEI
jgi:hypothetical protein